MATPRTSTAILAAITLAVVALAAGAYSPRGDLESMVVTATAYNALPDQTVGDPEVGAWGDHLRPEFPSIAVSRDLLEEGLDRGAIVTIDGLPGRYRVLDLMHRRWTRRIDIFMGKRERAALEWGKREVRIRWIEEA